ncbi:MAG TPA: hypothetical protein VHU90_01220 [Galbitalea sp.]|nr:hypothetical protein [Galbitalea sp.]
MPLQSKTISIVSAISAIGSVLGGVPNSLVVGLVAALLVAVLCWQIGSAARIRRLCRAD